jgi:calcineurin-like phosphoesterase family protein
LSFFKNLFFIIVLIINIEAHAKGTSFVVIGHLYPITSSDEKMRELFNKIRSLDPKYVFILGDSSLNNKEVYLKFYNEFKENVYFTPGNNEVSHGTLDEYKKNVGYVNKIINTNDANFILLNSLDSAANINLFLKNNNINNSKDKVGILLTHHRIWDDTLTSQYPYEHDKSYYFNDVYPLIKDKISKIFSGNSKRQYFSDYKQSNTGQNVNNIYWADQVGEITGYSIGTGDANPKLGFVYGEIFSGKLYIEAHHINYEGVDPIPINKIIPNRGSLAPAKSVKIIRNQSYGLSIYTYLKSTPKKYMLLISMIFGLIVGVLLTFVFYSKNGKT